MSGIRWLLVTLSLCIMLATAVLADNVPTFPTAFGPDAVVKPLARRGDDPMAKMTKELQILYVQFTRPGKADFVLSDEELSSLFGIRKGDKQPWVEIALQVGNGFDATRVEAAGAKVRTSIGDQVFVVVPVAALERVARERTVTGLQPVTDVEDHETLALVDLVRGSDAGRH